MCTHLLIVSMRRGKTTYLDMVPGVAHGLAGKLIFYLLLLWLLLLFILLRMCRKPKQYMYVCVSLCFFCLF